MSGDDAVDRRRRFNQVADGRSDGRQVERVSTKSKVQIGQMSELWVEGRCAHQP
jgi:hypothetical protein